MIVLLLLLFALPASAAEPESVTMSLDEFLKLYDASKPAPEADPEPPRHFALSSAHYTGEVVVADGEPLSAVFEATLRIDVLRKDGWIRVPVLPSDVALQSATIGGREADVVPDGSWLVLVTDRQGAFELKLRFAASVSTHEGRSSFGFTLAPAGATTAALAVPSDDLLDFEVAGAKLVTERDEDGLKHVEAVVLGTGSLAVSWQRALPEAAEEAVVEEGRIHAHVHTLVRLADGVLSERVAIDWTLLRGSASRFELAIPDGTGVVDVQGAAMRDWRVTDGVLGIELNYAESDRWSAVITLERLQDVGELTLPLAEPLGVHRARGWVGVVADGTLEVTAGAIADAAPLDGRLLPAKILGVTSSPILLGFKYLGSTATLPITVTRHENVAVLVTLLDEAHATTMVTDDGRRLTSMKYRVRNYRKQFLRLALPAGAELWSASVAGAGVQPARASDGRILLPLVRSSARGGALADFEVEVVYVETVAPPTDRRGSVRAALPTADVPIAYVAWTMWLPDPLKLKEADGSLRAVDGLSQPFSLHDQAATRGGPGANLQVAQGAQTQMAGGGLGEAAPPVAVRIPLEGQPRHFEKLLALDEELWVSVDYRRKR